MSYLEKFFGLIDIEIPKDKYNYFGEMSPIYKNVEYSEKKLANILEG